MYQLGLQKYYFVWIEKHSAKATRIESGIEPVVMAWSSQRVRIIKNSNIKIIKNKCIFEKDQDAKFDHSYKIKVGKYIINKMHSELKKLS